MDNEILTSTGKAFITGRSGYEGGTHIRQGIVRAKREGGVKGSGDMGCDNPFHEVLPSSRSPFRSPEKTQFRLSQ